MRCTLCTLDVYELVYTNSTSNLLYHLKTKHAREYRQLQEEDAAGPTMTELDTTRNCSHSVPTPQPKISEFAPFTGEKKRKLDQQCLLWLSSSMQPFLVAEDPGLKDWVSMISSGHYSPPCWKTLITMTPDLFLVVEGIVCKLAIEYMIHSRFGG